MAQVTLPPPSAGALWRTFLMWLLGVPVVVAAGIGIIWLALWAAGGDRMMARAESDMLTAVFWLGAIILLYPAMLWVWVSELRAGLRNRRRWDALSAEAQAEELAALAKAATKRSRRSSRTAGAA